MKSQGAKAVYSGRTFQGVVARIGQGVFDVKADTNVPIRGTNKYGDQLKAALFYPVIIPIAPNGFYVECQHQNTSGSAERRIESKCIEIVEGYNLPTVIVIDGFHSDRMRAVAKQYIGNGQLFDVLDLYSFWDFCLKQKDAVEPIEPTLFK